MLRHKYLRLAVFVCLGVVAAGVYSSAAAEKYQPDTNAPNAKARRDAARKVYETAWQRHVQSPDEASAAEFFRLEAEVWLFAVNYAVK